MILGRRGHTALLVGGAALSGVLQVLTFPRFSWYFLAAIAVAPLLIMLNSAGTASRRFLLGWLAGAVCWGGTCYWIFPVMRDYGNIAAPAAFAIYIGFLLAKGLHLAVFGFLAGPLLRRSWAIPAVAALWVAIEGTHQYLGFTWLHLGNAAAAMSVVAPLAPFTGVYGASFVLAMLNTAVAVTMLRRSRRELLWLAPLILLPLLPNLPEGETGDRPVRLVQPNIHPDELINRRWTAERHQRHLNRMLQLSTALADEESAEQPEILIWPEYTVPAYFFESPAEQRFYRAVARAADAHFIFNTISFTERNGERRPLNSAVVLGPKGELVAQYSKIFLVPFGEFVPWPFSLFMDKITLEAGDFAPGGEVVVAEVNGRQVGIYICYETVFARGVRRFTAQGAELLVNISNDSWYGRTAARYQHLLIARMRAIENQRYIVRATSDGITTVINRAGQISPALPSFEQGVLTAHFAYHQETTWFVRYGEWFWYLCGLAAIGFLIAARRKTPRR